MAIAKVFIVKSEFYFPEEFDLENNQNKSNYQAMATNNEIFEDEIKKFIE